MRYFTDIDDFNEGVAKLAKSHKGTKMMPVVLCVDGVMAPFGICSEEDVGGVQCLVFKGVSSSIKNITPETRKIQMDSESE